MIFLAMLCHCLESSAQCTLNVTPHASITVLCHCCLTQCDSNKTWLKERCFIAAVLCNLSGYCLRQKEAETIQYHPRKAEQRGMMVWMLQFVINSTWRRNMREKQKQSKQWQSLEIHRPLSKHIGWNISVVSSQEEERREQKQDRNTIERFHFSLQLKQIVVKSTPVLVLSVTATQYYQLRPRLLKIYKYHTIKWLTVWF